MTIRTARTRRGWRTALAAAGLTLGALAVGSATVATSASASARTGWLQLAHFSPNTPAVDVYLYSFHDPAALIVLHHVSYGTASGFEPVPAGEYTVAMRAAGAKPTSAPVLSTAVRVAPGAAYTVAGLGPAKALRLQVLPDRLTTPPGKALVRIIQASLTQHQVTFTAGSQVLANKLGFGGVTSFQVVKPGTWLVKAAGESAHTSASIQLAAGTIHTIVLLDDPGHLKLDNLVDAAGSQLIPAGAPKTGFGGMAPRPAQSPVPWLVTAGLGAMVTLAAASRVSRKRGVHGSHRRPRSRAAAS